MSRRLASPAPVTPSRTRGLAPGPPVRPRARALQGKSNTSSGVWIMSTGTRNYIITAWSCVYVNNNKIGQYCAIWYPLFLSKVTALSLTNSDGLVGNSSTRSNISFLNWPRQHEQHFRASISEFLKPCVNTTSQLSHRHHDTRANIMSRVNNHFLVNVL